MIPEILLLELKQTLLPVPAVCAGFHCNRCHSPVLHTDFPMDFYEDEHWCEEEPEQPEEPIDEDALNNYIDSVLDTDYDW